MKKITSHLFCTSLVFLLLSSCSSSPEEMLTITKEKYANAKYISFQSTSLWPDMIGVVDTTISRVEQLKDDSPLTGYSFSESKDRYDVLYADGSLQIFLHEDKKVRSEIPEDLTYNMSVAYNPRTYLSADGWVFEKDTVLDNTSLMWFSLLEKDTVYNGSRIRISKNIYINPEEYTIARQERLAFQNDTLGQKIIHLFNDYRFDDNRNELSYTLPEGYITEAKGASELKMPEVGDVAPSFSALTLNGDSISLEDFRGQKVLLDISVINCGYCKEALVHINTSANRFNENIKALYINPTDSKARMEKYMSKTAIPFPVIADRKDIGEAYGVNGYPTFFLIDEVGKIEEIHIGYTKAFIDRFL